MGKVYKSPSATGSTFRLPVGDVTSCPAELRLRRSLAIITRAPVRYAGHVNDVARILIVAGGVLVLAG